MYGACGRNSASSGGGAAISPVPSDHKPATARRSEDLPHPLGPTTSAASPSRSSRVRSRHSSRRERGVRTETRSRRSVAPSRGTPRRIELEGLVPAASRSAISSARRPFPLVAAPAPAPAPAPVPALALAPSSMASSIAKSRSRRSVSAASPESCSKRPTTMLSAPCTVRNAYPACVTTPNSTSPAKYLGAMMRLGNANVANSYALVKSARLRPHSILRRSVRAASASLARAAASSRAAPR